MLVDKQTNFVIHHRFYSIFCPGKSYNLFFDSSLTFSVSSFNLFWTSTYFVLFELILLLKLDSLSSNSVFFTKLAISLLPANVASANLAAKVSAVTLLSSGVVIYLSFS